MELQLLPQQFAVCQLTTLTQVDWQAPYCFLAKTETELSLVCPENNLPEQTLKCERGWRALKISGTLDFGLVGILAEIAGLLAEQQISIFAVSTYDTDYILLKAAALSNALSALRTHGYNITE